MIPSCIFLSFAFGSQPFVAKQCKFSKPQRRKANEGVRIAHLDPETRMNSKDEFMQGTNIFMHAVRGVGV